MISAFWVLWSWGPGQVPLPSVVRWPIRDDCCKLKWSRGFLQSVCIYWLHPVFRYGRVWCKFRTALTHLYDSLKVRFSPNFDMIFLWLHWCQWWSQTSHVYWHDLGIRWVHSEGLNDWPWSNLCQWHSIICYAKQPPTSLLWIESLKGQMNMSCTVSKWLLKDGYAHSSISILHSLIDWNWTVLKCILMKLHQELASRLLSRGTRKYGIFGDEDIMKIKKPSCECKGRPY